MERESMQFDVVIVGGGPSGLSAAIRLKQLGLSAGREISVCVLEKASEIGAHILSGAVIEPRSLSELFPNWEELGAPLHTSAGKDRFLYLTKKRALRLPTPPQMHNKGNYIASLGNLCRWLAERAEELEVEVYPGFAAAEVLYNDQGVVKGVATGDMGMLSDGTEGPNFERGMELHAKQTIFAEGARVSN
jgi:electron-transferring-flavoprotein dehydrogenase